MATTSFPRLSAEEIARVRDEHSLVDVLGRVGVDPPRGWDGHSDFMICCPCPDHVDSTPSCVVHPQTDRFHCFGCQVSGDVLELVVRIEGIRSLTKAAQILDSRRQLKPGPARREVQAGTARMIDTADRPDPSRTTADRVLELNAEAWRYLTLPKLAARGRAYLASRSIDVSALELQAGRPLVGHTPFAEIGLVEHLTREGFTSDEIVDGGWGARRDGQLRDRFRRRVLIPARDEQDRVIGVYGRDVTGRANQKYLNTAETIAFHKGDALYQPVAFSEPNPRATVVICEGTLDALAIAAHGAAADASDLIAAVSPSGTALTAQQARRLLAISNLPPVVCADGDPAGVTASAKWIRTLTTQGRETLVTVLPDDHDPASWLSREGSSGLGAFLRTTAEARPGEIRPTHGAELLGHDVMATALEAPDASAFSVLPSVVQTLAADGHLIGGRSAQHRFSTAAAKSLANYGVGTEAGLSRMLQRRMDAISFADDRAAAGAYPQLHLSV